MIQSTAAARRAAQDLVLLNLLIELRIMKTSKQKRDGQLDQLYCFQKNLLDFEAAEKSKDVENVLKEIRGTARDGLSFLKVVQLKIEPKHGTPQHQLVNYQVRRNFWETSEPPVVGGRKGVKRYQFSTQTPPSPTFLPGPNRTQAGGGQISHQEEWPPKLQAQQVVVMAPNSLWCQNVLGG